MSMPKNKLFNRGNVELSKPDRLSAFGHLNSSEFLNYLLEKSDKELEGVDYRDLLNSNILAGTFEETVYYLPLAVDYLCSNNDDRGEMVDEFVDYLFINKDKIESCFNLELKEILDHVLSCNIREYSVVQINKTECRKLGWGIDSYRYVRRRGMVIELFKNISKFKSGKDWIEKKIEELKNGNLIEKKWLYELYEECNEIFGLYLDDDMMLELLDSLDNDDQT